MPSPFFDFSAKIKDIYLELNDFQFFHSPFGIKQPDERFIGRRAVQKRLKMILNNSQTKSGAYLITGFRGMGKTSVVRKAIFDLNKQYREKKFEKYLRTKELTLGFELIVYILLFGMLLLGFSKYNDNDTIIILSTLTIFLIVFFASSLFDLFTLKIKRGKNNWIKFERIEIYLSQGEVKDIDVLRQITNRLHNKWENYDQIKSISLRSDFFYFIYNFFNAIIYYLLIGFSEKHQKRTSYNKILKELNYLKQRLSSELTFSDEMNLGPSSIKETPLPFSFKRNNQAFFPQAKGKEIESELVQILFDIEELRKLRQQRLNGRWKLFWQWIDSSLSNFEIPEFIFVIDELDKIEPNYNYSTDEQDALDIAMDNSRGMFASEKIRQRQETIASLLANLKSFLNIAMAKFIFIGGREMYDASMADIADRDSFYSSIFHDIIYINSFFKDKIEIRSGVTRMTEAYLCSLLLPSQRLNKLIENYKKEHEADEAEGKVKEKHLKLKYYFEYLAEKAIKERGIPFPKNLSLNEKLDRIGEKEELYKIFFMLQNFIIFLTYRSNGTPKKLTGLIEDFIVRNTPATERLKNKSQAIVIDNKPENGEKRQNKFYLCFKYNRQYEIGLTASLYRPYLIIHSRYLKALGDKLLFSNAFILDHILKFHPFGFSWRNLELIPEIILINKEPNLRGFIADLINFLSNTYLRVTITGVNQFKFYKKVANELEYISKISDLSSAAFNFTLDESLLIKRHYRKKLEDALNHYSKFYPRDGESRYLYSIGFIQNILGDLHYFDKEFDDALMYYYDAAQYLDDCYSFDNMAKQRLVLLIQNQLKLGQTMEKIRSYNSAFSIYQQLTINSPVYLSEIVDKDKQYAPTNFEGIKPYRGLQLINKGYIAWLSLIEKQRFDGLTRVNITQNRVAISDLLKMRKEKKKRHLTDFHRYSFLLGDYYNNVGSILFYKNKNFTGLLDNIPKREKEIDFYLFNKWEPTLLSIRKDAAISYSAFQYYYISLSYFVRAVSEDLKSERDKQRWKSLSSFSKTIELLNPSLDYAANANARYHFGNLFSKLGDAILTFIQKDPQDNLQQPAFDIFVNKTNNLELLSALKSWANQFNSRIKNSNQPEKVFNLNTVFYFYRIASLFYLKAGRSYSYAFQYKKALYVIKDHLVLKGLRIFRPFDDKVSKKEAANRDFLIKRISTKDPQGLIDLIHKLEDIAMRIIHTYTKSYEVSNRPQILKYREIFQLNDNKKSDKHLLYNNLASSHETREVLTLIREVKLKLKRLRIKFFNPLDKRVKDHQLHNMLNIPLKDFLTSPFSSISNKFVRMLELKYRCERNYFLITHYLQLEDIFKNPDLEDNNKQSLLEIMKKKVEKAQISEKDIPKDMVGTNLVRFLINDSIFCLFDVLKTQDIYGISYIINHSYRANAHYKLANWCQALTNLKAICPEEETLKMNEALEELLGTDATYNLESNYHNELAIKHYQAAIEMHTEGKAYKDRLHDMYFLEDDFNDNLFHFCAANERYRLNTSLILSKLKELEETVRKTSTVYKFSSYEQINP